MSVYSSAIAERLNVVSLSDNPNSFKIIRPDRTTYSVARFGLLSPTEMVHTPKPGVDNPPSPFSRGTYKLPRILLERLKARANASDKYQYTIVADAIEEHLDRSAPASATPCDESPANQPNRQNQTNINCWHRFKRNFAGRFRPVRRIIPNQ